VACTFPVIRRHKALACGAKTTPINGQWLIAIRHNPEIVFSCKDHQFSLLLWVGKCSGGEGSGEGILVLALL